MINNYEAILKEINKYKINIIDKKVKNKDIKNQINNIKTEIEDLNKANSDNYLKRFLMDNNNKNDLRTKTAPEKYRNKNKLKEKNNLYKTKYNNNLLPSYTTLLRESKYNDSYLKDLEIYKKTENYNNEINKSIDFKIQSNKIPISKDDIYISSLQDPNIKEIKNNVIYESYHDLNISDNESINNAMSVKSKKKIVNENKKELKLNFEDDINSIIGDKIFQKELIKSNNLDESNESNIQDTVYITNDKEESIEEDLFKETKNKLTNLKIKYNNNIDLNNDSMTPINLINKEKEIIKQFNFENSDLSLIKTDTKNKYNKINNLKLSKEKDLLDKNKIIIDRFDNLFKKFENNNELDEKYNNTNYLNYINKSNKNNFDNSEIEDKFEFSHKMKTINCIFKNE